VTRFATLASAVLAAVACATAATAAGPGAERDVRALADAIRANHPDPYHSIPRAELDAAVDALAARAPTLHDDVVLVELMRILALLGERDGHAGIHPLHTGHTRPMHILPVRLHLFSDGYWVVAEVGRLGLVGKRLVAIDGVPIEQVAEQVRPLITRDSEWTVRARLPQYVLVTEVLHGLGLASDAGARRLTFADAAGARQDVVLDPVAAPAYVGALLPQFGPYVYGLPRRARPLYLAKKHLPRYLTTLDKGATVYLAYNVTQGYTGALADRLVRLASKARARRVVVDIRNNGGGDNTTYSPLIRALQSKRIKRRVGIYVLIGRETFSAAGNFAAELDRRTRAVFAGEPTGGAPNQWGDLMFVRLPVSGWEVVVPPVFIVSVPGDNRVAVEPQIPVETSSADFFAGRDPVLDAVRRR
jgi:hypothetical protein